MLLAVGAPAYSPAAVRSFARPHTDAVTAILNFGHLPKARILAHFEAYFSTLRQRERTTARSHTKTQLIWMVVLSVLYVPSMVSIMLLRRGPD